MAWIKQSVMIFNFVGCKNLSVESYTEETRDVKRPSYNFFKVSK